MKLHLEPTHLRSEELISIVRMNRPAVLYIILGLQLLKGLASAQSAPTAKAVIKDGKGRQVGIAILTESAEGLRIAVDAENLPPGSHGFHIHSTGKCDQPDFKSAGPHFNPGAMKHGMKNPDGPHAGDLQDIEVGADGKVKTSVTAKQVTLGAGKNSLFPEGGTALVIHADPDNERTDPEGNSGERIACGVITLDVITAFVDNESRENDREGRRTTSEQ